MSSVNVITESVSSEQAYDTASAATGLTEWLSERYNVLFILNYSPTCDINMQERTETSPDGNLSQ